MTRKPHDALAQRTFSDPTVAGGYLHSVVPAELAAQLDFSRIELQERGSTDPSLRQRTADFVYEVPFKGEGSLLLCVLLEHQSRVDWRMAARLYVYTARAHEAWSRKNPRARRVSAVLPLVLYNGRARWTAPRSLHDLYALPPEISDDVRACLPQLRYCLDDLRRQTDEALRQRSLRPMGVLTLLLLRHGRGAGGLPRLSSSVLRRVQRPR